MADKERCCGTCKWWEGKTPGWEYGFCKDALARARKAVPSSVFIPFGGGHDCDQTSVKVTQMASFAGENCPCWEKKDAI